VEEVKVGISILESLGMRQRRLEIVSCPSCGRAQVDVYKLAEEVTAGLEGMEVPLRVAVMGCVVNGPGEAREADLGVASGNGKGQIFVRGKVIATVPESADRRDADRGGHAPRRAAQQTEWRKFAGGVHAVLGWATQGVWPPAAGPAAAEPGWSA
jgi:sulfite reductase beta subunit-like hemoprotein